MDDKWPKEMVGFPISAMPARKTDFDFHNIRISGALQSDYLTVACRTAYTGMMGLSLFLVDAKSPGVKIRKMKTQFDSSHSTCFVTLEDVEVSSNDMIGEENAGFMYLVQVGGDAKDLRFCD